MPSPNPRGRPPAGESPTAVLRAILAEPYAPGSDVTKLQHLLRCALDRALRDGDAGDLRLSDLAPIFSRLDGNPPLGIDVSVARERLEDMERARLRASQLAGSARATANLKAMGQI